MPKIKTKRGAAKRFKISKNGKVIYAKSFGSHILTKKTRKRKRSLRKSQVLSAVNSKAIKRMVPYL
jgi:large subunit ribosomal protein L35